MVTIVEILAPTSVDDDEMAEILGNVRLQEKSRTSILLDITEVQDYSMEAHRVLIDWAKANAKRLDRIAVLSDHSIWDCLVSVLAKESKVSTKTFSTHDRATLWLGQARS